MPSFPGVFTSTTVCAAAAARCPAHSTDGELEPSNGQSLWPPGAPADVPQPGQPANADDLPQRPARAVWASAGPQRC